MMAHTQLALSMGESEHYLHIYKYMVLFINIVGSKLFIPGKLQYMGHDYDHHLMSLVSSKE